MRGSGQWVAGGRQQNGGLLPFLPSEADEEAPLDRGRILYHEKIDAGQHNSTRNVEFATAVLKLFKTKIMPGGRINNYLFIK